MTTILKSVQREHQCLCTFQTLLLCWMEKIGTLTNSQDAMSQNSDYNGQTSDMYQGTVLLWDPFGKIVNAAINMPGSFHDSKQHFMQLCTHIADLPDPLCMMCDSTFQTRGKLGGTKFKSKFLDKDKAEINERDASLTHLRQCSEWGNQVLVGVFWHLKIKLETDNIQQAQLLWACIRLHNIRTDTVQRNQILTYFDNLCNNEHGDDETEDVEEHDTAEEQN